MAEPKLSLHRKLAQVMYEAERIPKNGIGPREQGSYPFVQVGDAADFIRKALAEKVVTMMPTKVTVVGQSDRPTLKGGTMTTVDLVVEWTITDGESGESIKVESFGAGADTGDKYSGKASTSAMKYALLTGFLLSTGEDSENTDTSDRQSRPAGPKVLTARDAHPVADTVAETAAASPFQTSEQGVVEFAKSGPADGELRSGPDGSFLVFRLAITGGKVLPQVAAYGPLAEALATLRRSAEFLPGMEVICSGVVTPVPFKGRGTFQRMTLARIERLGPDGWTLPAPSVVAPEPTQSDEPPALAPEDQAELDALWPDVVERAPA